MTKDQFKIFREWGAEGGKKGGKKGGDVRAKKLTPEERSKIARKAAMSRWGGKKRNSKTVK